MKNSHVEKLLETAAKATAEARSTLKAKMLKAPNGPLGLTAVEVTPAEFAYTLTNDFHSLIEEVERERDSSAQAKVYSPSEAGLAAMAGFKGEPDHAAHLDQVQNLKEAIQPFEEVVKPLMKWLAQNACPHHHVVVSATSAELFQGQKSFNTFEFIKD